MSKNFESTYESSLLNQDLWKNDSIVLSMSSYSSPDTLVFTNSGVVDGFGEGFGEGSGEDRITFEYPDNLFLNLPHSHNNKVMSTEDTNKNGFWKYEEDKTLKEVESYLSSTYHSHYTSETSKTQTLDLIESIGDAEAFTRSNAIKYLSRFGKKNGKSKQDILKAIHYCILLYHFAGLHKKTVSDFSY